MEYPHLTGGSGRTKRLLLLAIPVALALTVALAAVFSARRVLNRAAQTTANEGQLAFTLRTVDPSSNQAGSLGSEAVASGPNYTTGAFFAGELYLGGQSGLTVIRSDGSSRLNLRAGFELPVAAIVLRALDFAEPTSRNFCLQPAARACCCLNRMHTRARRSTNSWPPTPRLAT